MASIRENVEKMVSIVKWVNTVCRAESREGMGEGPERKRPLICVCVGGGGVNTSDEEPQPFDSACFREVVP